MILALGLIAIVRDLRTGQAAPDHAENAGRSPWLLLLPVLAIFLVSPPASGADTVSRSAGAVAAPQRSIEFPPLPAVDRACAGTLRRQIINVPARFAHWALDVHLLARFTASPCAGQETFSLL